MSGWVALLRALCEFVLPIVIGIFAIFILLTAKIPPPAPNQSLEPTAGRAMTLIEIRPHRWGWKVFEAPGVEPVFSKKGQAIDYAQNRACFQSGEIRVLDSTGNIEHTIAFSGADRKLITGTWALIRRTEYDWRHLMIEKFVAKLWLLG